MMQVIDGAIVEMQQMTMATTMASTAASASGGMATGFLPQTSNCYEPYPFYQTWPSTVWYNYPVYTCTDKTAKAISVLKALQAEKLLKCDSVPKFIELVEKIANLL